MSDHLLLLTIGPVQGFIAQARRTRDLWFGSHLLSELSKAAALELHARGGELIFPGIGGVGDLAPSDHPFGRDDQPVLSVSNKILVRLPGAVGPEDAAKGARAAVRKRWRQLTDGVREKCRGLLAGQAIDPVWDEQVDTFLEFLAAWEPLGDGYPAARRRVEEAIASRKYLREFSQWTRQRGGVPKSSLDGARETVLAPPEGRHRGLVRQYRIAEGEQLDAVGLVKRAGGQPEQFVPLCNVAFAGWIDQAAQRDPDGWRAFQRACSDIGLPRINRPDLRWIASFPFDAQVLMEDRWPSLADELGDGGGRLEKTWWRDHAGRIIRDLKAGTPSPYVACLVADGDSMGAAIEAIGDPDGHRRFSRTLSRFPVEARRIVEDEHQGCLVYSGGDDVLAFVCLTDAIPCADRLRKAFSAIMAESGLDGLPLPTISVGIGIGHVLDGMGSLLKLGRQAEKLAKSGRLPPGQARNALAVVLDKRSGGQWRWRMRWDRGPAEQFRRDTAVFRSGLSSKKVYEVHRDLGRFPEPSRLDAGPAREWAAALEADISRTIARSEGAAGERLTPAMAGLDFPPATAGYRATYDTIRNWCERMLIVRTMMQAAPEGGVQ